MLLLRDIALENFRQCSYFPDRIARFEYFFARDVSAAELDALLFQGWRKFGLYYFRPACKFCSDCQPIRVLVEKFKPSKSQRRVLKKNQNVHFRIGPLAYSPEVYAIYQDHSWNRFCQKTSLTDLLTNQYSSSCPSLQSEYYLDDELIAVDFLDVSRIGLSSCYFIYRTCHSTRSLGTYSVLAELKYAASLQKQYYYLGYYIAANHHMAYKNHFYPHEIFDWKKKIWEKI